MIEAVNSVIQNAPFIRASAEQTSTADSYAANPARTQRVAQTGYITPFYTEDLTTFSEILEIRDPTTGKVLDKIPSRPTGTAGKTDNSDHGVSSQLSSIGTPTTSQTSPTPTTGTSTSTTTPQTANNNDSGQSAVYAQQLAAFSNAAQSGNTNAGTVSFFV